MPEPPVTPPPTSQGCRLQSAAFCDTFDAPSATRGRAGDLDPSLWSVSRGNAQFPTGNGAAIPAGPATLPACRTGQPAKVFPNDDSLICDATAGIQSRHMLAAVGAQNYGQNSYRIRQPFDFANRTGRIFFDVEATMHHLLGWFSLAVTEDPTPIPGYSIGAPGQTNDEGGTSPRNAFIVLFTACDNDFGTYTVRFIDVFKDHVDSLHTATNAPCLAAKKGNLNRIEVRVSKNRIDVYGTPYSTDGLTYSTPTLLYGANVDLPFTRGHVQLTVHNHATLKYANQDAWFTRFDNVGFDGPVVSNFREYEIPDSLVSGSDAWYIPGPVMNVGYRVRDASAGPAQVLKLKNVQLQGVTSARLAIASWYLIEDAKLPAYVLKYRLNGKAWRTRTLTAGELALLRNGHQMGQLAQMLPVPLADLVEGENTLEFVTENVPQNYPPAVSAIDLILATQ